MNTTLEKCLLFSPYHHHQRYSLLESLMIFHVDCKVKADPTHGLVLACLGLLGISCLVILCSLVLVTVLQSVSLNNRHQRREHGDAKLENRDTIVAV